MSLISSSIANLINGVSQQPYTLRLASQCEEQINGFSSVVSGLTKRAPSNHVVRVSTTPTANAFTHLINRDAVERYQVVARNRELRVFRLADGVEMTVEYPNGTDYLVSTAPEDDFEAVTVADYTFFVNKSITVATDPAVKTPSRPFEAIVWVRQGAYSTLYELTVNAVNVTYATEAPNDTTNGGTTLRTDTIASSLRTKLETAGINSEAGYTISVYGSVIYISHNTTDFTISARDSQGDSAMKAIKSTVQRFTDLPARAVNGFTVRVKGDLDQHQDDYYVVYEAVDNPQGGVWRETAKPAEISGLLQSAMPHVLVRISAGSFQFRQAGWQARKVGDETSVPFPSFVGRKINDVFFHRNRLAFLADENVIMSEAGQFFNFFRTSALQTLDTDPIDIAATHTKVSILKRAVPFNETLMLFSDQSQFMFGRAEILTPKTVSVQQTTEFETKLRARPVAAGQNVFVTSERGGYTNILEFYVDADTETKDAANVTAHAPKYVPANVVKLTASSNEDMLVALSADARNRLYVYRYFWSGREKLQSAWSRWDFSETDTILNIGFIGSDLWLLISRPHGTFLETINCAPGLADGASSMVVNLDRRMSNTAVTARTYNATTNKTSFTVPYKIESGETYELVAWTGDATYKPGTVVPFTTSVSGSDTIISASGDLTAFWFGRRYTFRYHFSPQVLREEAAGGGQQPVRAGRLQLRKMILALGLSGYFRAEVTPSQRGTYRYIFTGRVLGSAASPLGEIALTDGTFSFPVAAKNDQVTIELINDTYLPCAFLSAEWEAFFTTRSRRT